MSWESGPAVSAVGSVISRLTGRRASQRVEIADGIWAFIVFLNEMPPPSDRDVWVRLSGSFSAWGRNGAVPPVVIDDLQKILEVLEPGRLHSDARKQEARGYLCEILKEERASLVTPDWITREFHDTKRLFGSASRTRRRQLGKLAAPERANDRESPK